MNKDTEMLPLIVRCALTAVALAGGAPQGAVVHFLPRNSGAYDLSTVQTPIRVPLSNGVNGVIVRPPALASNPQFGVITLGPKEDPTRLGVVADNWDSASPRLWIDRTGSGDLTVGCDVILSPQPYQAADKQNYTMLIGTTSVQVKYGSTVAPVTLRIMRYDPSDPARALYRNSVLYNLDSATAGSLQLGDRMLHAMLYDTTGVADYRGRPGGVILLIDANDNGAFDKRGETYEATQPFNIRGITYELQHISPAGDSFEVVKSKTHVEEIPPPPDLRPGKPVPPFTGVDLAGNTVHFPEDYKGKIVMLMFYASWCPDCRGEMPNIVANYNRCHDKGVEALGISLDKADGRPSLEAFTKNDGITWRQVYDGQGWHAAIAQTYMIGSIPTVILVDGTTGRVLAAGDDKTLGKHLGDTLDLELRRKARRQSPSL
jgi:peroxiredoxin